VRELLDRLPKRLPEKGESYWRFTRTFNGLLGSYGQAAVITSRYVGGLHLRGNHRGDPGERHPLVPVSATDQRRALTLLRQYVFDRQAFNLPKAVYLKLAPNPTPDLISAILGQEQQDSPVRDRMSAIQRAVLSRLLSSLTLSRVSNNEFKSNAGATLTMPTLFNTLTSAIWEEAATAASVGALRRQLQRAHLLALRDMLVRPASGLPDDARMLARHHLRTLKGRLAAAGPKVKDEYTRIHYREAISLIDQALDAKLNIGATTAPLIFR